jgi:hypothetical protein
MSNVVDLPGVEAGTPSRHYDLSTEQGRFSAVQWGITAEGEQTLRVPASPENDRRQNGIRQRWLGLFDKPEALRVACDSMIREMRR